MNWNSNWERSYPSWIISSLQQPFVSGVVDSSRLVMGVLYTFLCNISHMLLSTAFKCGEFRYHSCSKLNSGVSFGSVETLFRWDGKRLYHFAADLFRKWCTKFRLYCLSFTGDITRKHFGLFFPGHSDKSLFATGATTQTQTHTHAQGQSEINRFKKWYKIKHCRTLLTHRKLTCCYKMLSYRRETALQGVL